MGFRDALKKAEDDLKRKTGGAVTIGYKKVKCPKCNKEYPSGTKICLQCGEA